VSAALEERGIQVSDLIIRPVEHLPVKLEDLAAFVLIGREHLTAVRAAIRAMEKMEIATEVRAQKMEEARMVSDALIDAEVRIGELTKAMPKASQGNQYTGKTVKDSATPNQNQAGKYETAKDLGFSPKQVQRFEMLAGNKDLVEQAKAEAREEGVPVTRARALALIKQSKQEPSYAEQSKYKHT